MENLKADARAIGKPAWRPMLRYVAELHERSTHPPRAPFPHPWEEIGPGYCYGPAFGHWDIVHAILDVMASEPQHAADQILNNLAAQEAGRPRPRRDLDARGDAAVEQGGRASAAVAGRRARLRRPDRLRRADRALFRSARASDRLV